MHVGLIDLDSKAMPCNNCNPLPVISKPPTTIKHDITFSYVMESCRGRFYIFFLYPPYAAINIRFLEGTQTYPSCGALLSQVNIGGDWEGGGLKFFEDFSETPAMVLPQVNGSLGSLFLVVVGGSSLEDAGNAFELHSKSRCVIQKSPGMATQHRILFS